MLKIKFEESLLKELRGIRQELSKLNQNMSKSKELEFDPEEIFKQTEQMNQPARKPKIDGMNGSH